MLIILIFFMALLLAASILYYVVIYAPAYKGPVSDHFDGKRFHNQASTREARSKDLIKWMKTREIGYWPEYINSPPGPPPPVRVPRGKLRVTFVNHATVLIQMDNLNILTDPIWSERSSPIDWIGPKRVRPPGIRLEDLPPIDYVLISHNHYDQLNIKTLRWLHKKFNPAIITGLGNSKLLTKKGIGNSRDIDWWQRIELTEDVLLTGVPAQHFSSRGLFDHNKTLWLGFVIEGSVGPIYFPGDTGYGPHFRQIAEHFGPIYFALLPIGAYKPRWFMSPVHMDPQQAVQAHKDLGAHISMGIHFGTFIGLADDGQKESVEELYKALDDAGIPRSQFWVLDFGEGRNVPPKS
jgi:L-ascorbate metabolism protein UlaG (beta-lactamase superfamily)